MKILIEKQFYGCSAMLYRVSHKTTSTLTSKLLSLIISGKLRRYNLWGVADNHSSYIDYLRSLPIYYDIRLESE